jgi:hypothetical protein
MIARAWLGRVSTVANLDGHGRGLSRTLERVLGLLRTTNSAHNLADRPPWYGLQMHFFQARSRLREPDRAIVVGVCGRATTFPVRFFWVPLGSDAWYPEKRTGSLANS